MDATNFLAPLASVVALVAASFVGLQRGRITRAEATTEALSRDVTREQSRVTSYRDDLADVREKLDAATVRIGQLESDLRHSDQLASGAVHWSVLTDMIDHHHTEAVQHWTITSSKLDSLHSRLDEKDGAR